MTENKRYYWLKMYDDLFKSKRIKKLRKLSSDFFIIYLKLQLISLKDGGRLVYTGVEDSFASELALEIDEDSDKVQITLAFLQSCGLLEVEGNEYILPYVEKCTGSETQSTRRSRKSRENKALRELACNNDEKALHCNTHATNMQRECNGDRRDREIEIRDKDNLSYRYINLDPKDAIIQCWKDVTGKNIYQNNSFIDKSIDQFDINFILESIQMISKSDYLMGKTDHKITIQYKWFLKNIYAVHDGKFSTFLENTGKKRNKTKNKTDEYNQFPQNNYDFDDLENEFLANK